MKMFQALKNSLSGTPQILPYPTDLKPYITDPNRDWYISLYQYNEKHKLLIEEKKSFKGIEDTTTDRLMFDMDSSDLEEARMQTSKLIGRLIDDGFDSESIRAFFTGKKGFSLEIEIKERLTPEQFKVITKSLSQDFSCLDTKITDPVRIVRVVNTKHQVSGLFKIPLDIDEVQTLSVDEIKSLAQGPRELNAEFTKSQLPVSYKVTAPKKLKAVSKTSSEIDWMNKPKEWRNCKWSLLQGLFNSGERHHALTVIAATCRGLGYDRETAYYMCKSAIKKQAKQYKSDEFSTDEVWENILESIYSPAWKGGQYSCQNDIWLQEKCDALGDHKCSKDKNINPTIQIEEAYSLFKDYAENIDKLTIKTGITPLDSNLRMTIGMLVGLVAPAGVGKCLGKGTPVLMYDGTIKNVEDIRSGDLLMGDDSTPRKVLSTCKGQELLYEIQQETGMNYVVNESHILSLKGSFAKNNKRLKYIQYGNIVDIELKEYLQKSNQFKQYMKGYRNPIEFKQTELPLSPYFLGYWLGDGTTDKPEITFGKTDINHISWFEEYALKNNCFVTKYQDQDCIRLNFSGARGNNVVWNNLPEQKLIPQNYLVNSRQNRLELLAGIIDSDGHYNKARHIYEITTKSEQLAEQIQDLCNLLGFRTRISASEKYCLYKGEKRTGLYYRVYIKGNQLDEIPCKIERKKHYQVKQQRYYDLSKIQVVSKGVGDYYGFEIDGNKRFVLKDGTITHNTSISLQVLNTMSKNEELCVFFSFDMFHALVFQKLVQKHFQKDADVIFDDFANKPEVCNEITKTLGQEYKNVEFCFDAGQTPDQMAQTIKSVEDKRAKKVRFIVVDYNELVLSDKADPTAHSAYVIQKLREIANTQNLCVLILLQPNKMSGNPAEEINSYHAAKGSSAISQAVSIMLGINRPGYDPKKPESDKFITVNCLKNRMGKLFSVDLHWEGLTGTVRELTMEEEADLWELRKQKKAEKDQKADEWL